jgi:hypothetical protein
MYYNNQEHQWLFRAVRIAGVAIEGVRRLSQVLSPSEFEMVYQIRVAIDRIRFAIKETERSAIERSGLQQASLVELLEALDRLQSAERSFRARSGSTQRDRGLTYEWSHR